jgi:hypothetical protein
MPLDVFVFKARLAAVEAKMAAEKRGAKDGKTQ